MALSDLLAAVAMLLLLEGILPFLSPGRARRLYEQLSEIGERELRFAGLVSMLIGLGLLFYARN